MKSKTTRRALVLSLLSLLLCCSMLVGTTFAWFTDSVTSGNNKIVAGNLDIELYWSTDCATWNKVTTETNIFDEGYWEPGHTEVVYLKAANEGTLNLKYQLGVNVASEIAGTNKDNEKFNLSDYIEYGVVKTTAKYADRDAARAAVTKATKLASPYSSDVIKLAPKGQTGSTETVALVVYMPETVGNEANYKTGTAAPTINLGLNVFATQVEAEFDSFGNDYDKDAAFSTWNGTVPAEMPASLVVDGKTQTIHVQDADAFAYLSTLSAKWAEFYTDGNGTTYTNYANGAGAAYYYSGKWTISLEADIDLNNKDFAPVVIMIGENTGASAFDGNGHTIRNINTTTGLFADKARASFSNLTLVNVNATNGALAGSADHDISNVTVKNATISGTDYVGGVVGYTYGAVNGCKVIDSSVTATGKEAGGLVGYAATSREESSMANNTVRNVSVYANNRAAGLAAQVNVKIKVYNNVIDTVTVGAEDTSKYQCGAVVSNALAPENVYDNTVVNANVLSSIAMVENTNELTDAVTAGATNLVLADGTYVVPSNVSGKTVTITGNGDTVIDITTVPTYAGLPGATITFENVTIKSDPQGAGYNRGFAHTNYITYNNCVINGTLGLNTDTEFNGCTFNISGNYYNLWTWGATNVTLNGCTFNSDGKAVLLYGGSNTKLTVDSCVFNDNGGLTDKKAAIEIGNDYDKSYELIVNNTVVNGYEINDEGINTGSTLWGNKNSMGTNKLNVVVDGIDVY